MLLANFLSTHFLNTYFLNTVIRTAQARERDIKDRHQKVNAVTVCRNCVSYPGVIGFIWDRVI